MQSYMAARNVLSFAYPPCAIKLFQRKRKKQKLFQQAKLCAFLTKTIESEFLQLLGFKDYTLYEFMFFFSSGKSVELRL